MPLVVAAEYEGDFRVHLRFNDGLAKIVDLRPLLVGPVFEPVLSPSTFRRFFIEAGTLGWPCGPDLAPEALYALPAINPEADASLGARTVRS